MMLNLVPSIPPIGPGGLSTSEFVYEDYRQPKNSKLAAQIKRDDEEILLIIKVIALCY
jgi:hypothetical protein